MPSEIQELEDLTGYFVAAGKVVKIAFDVRPKRILAPGLIERVIPNVQTRPLEPEQTAQHSTAPEQKKLDLATEDSDAAMATATAFD